MAFKAINLAKTKTIELESDPEYGTDAATKFTIGALDGRVLSLIKDKATGIPMSTFGGGGDGMATLRMNEMNFDIVVHGLKGVDNYDVAFTTTQKQLGGKTYLVADPDFVATIPDEITGEIAEQILNINTLTEEERKN